MNSRARDDSFETCIGIVRRLRKSVRVGRAASRACLQAAEKRSLLTPAFCLQVAGFFSNLLDCGVDPVACGEAEFHVPTSEVLSSKF
jgi:hypothetical protein